MERVHVCLCKEKKITTGRVETTVHPLANGMSSTLLSLQSRLNVGLRSYPPRQSILQAFHFLQLLNESIPALGMKCDNNGH